MSFAAWLGLAAAFVALVDSARRAWTTRGSTLREATILCPKSARPNRLGLEEHATTGHVLSVVGCNGRSRVPDCMAACIHVLNLGITLEARDGADAPQMRRRLPMVSARDASSRDRS